MDNQPRRITLILGSPDLSGHRWNVSSDGASRLIFVGNFAMLRHGLRSGVAELCQDVERVVLEDGATAVQYLELLSSLPREFVGDALFVGRDGAGFISAVGRGGDRVLDSLRPHDLDFYLSTHGLVDLSSMLCLIPEGAGEFAVVAAA